MTVAEYPAVTDDQYRRVDARMLDIKRRLTQKGGPPFDPETLIELLQKAAEGEFGLTRGSAEEVIAALERWNHAGKRFWQKLLSDLQLRQEVADLVASRMPTNGSVHWNVAKQIMGDNFHGLHEAEKYFDIEICRTELEVPFIGATLETLAETHLLMYAPPVSMVDIYDKASYVFATSSPSGEPAWYTYEENRRAYSNAKIESGWYLVRKEAQPHTHQLTWKGGQDNVTSPYFTPRASLATYAYAIHFLETGEKLFRLHNVAVADTAPRGARINMGYGHDWNGPGSGGLYISTAYGPKGTGVAVARGGTRKG